MSTRKLRNSWWVDFRFRGIRHRVRSPENSRAGATAYETLLRHKLASGEPLVEPKDEPRDAATTYGEFAKEWLETYVRTNNRPCEQAMKRSRLAHHVLPFFGDMSLAEIGERHIELFKLRKREEGLAPKTVNHLLSVLGKSLATAHEWRMIETVPRRRLLRVPPQRFDYLSRDESRQLLDAAKGDPLWHAMILCALRTGLRVSELMGLDWPDVDFPNGQLTVQRSLVKGHLGAPKNNRTRVVPMSDDLAAALVERRGSRGPVFAIAGDRLGYGEASYALWRICRLAGLRRVGWHALRHTFASQLVMANVPIRAVQELLGHATLDMTMRYSHLSPSVLRAAVNLLPTSTNELLADSGQPAVNAALAPRVVAP